MAARLPTLIEPMLAEIPTAFLDGGVDPGDLLTAAADNGLEGIIAKRLASSYRPGRRSPDWVKVPLARTQEVIIVGWRPGAGRPE